MKFNNNYNPYYNPERCGLEIFDTVVEPNLYYRFNMLVIWRKIDDNTLWYAIDSGDSRAIPFDQTAVDLEQITDKTFSTFDFELKNFRGIKASEYSKISMLVRKQLKIK